MIERICRSGQTFHQENLDNGIISMPYIAAEQVAGVLEKRLCKKQFESLVSKIAMEDIFMPARRGVWK